MIIVLKKSGLGAQLRKLPRGPDLAELHQMLSQSLEHRGKPVKVTWRGANLTPFTLEVLCHVKSGNAQWKLYTEQNPSPLFDYTSVDVLLVYNLVAANCAEVQQQQSAARTMLTEEAHAAEQALNQAAGEANASAQAQAAARPLTAPPGQPTQDLPLPRQTTFPSGLSAVEKVGSSQNVSPIQADHASDAGSTYDNLGIESPVILQSVSPILPPVPSKPYTTAETDLVSREGEVKEGLMAEWLQGVARARATGRLDVRNNDLTAQVFISNGRPIDATASDATGDEAVIELLTWKHGTYTFELHVQGHNKNVYDTVESLIAQSRKLNERIEYLKNAGMLSTSTLVPVSALVSQLDFAGRVSDNCPCDIDTISNVYRSLDGTRSFEETATFLRISRVQLVHIIFHLLIKELIKIVNEKPASVLTLKLRVIDHSTIDSIMMSLRRSDTGLFIYPAFLYFLEQEYFRSYRSRTSLSVAVFELRQKKVIDGKIVRRVLDERALMDAMLRISNLKRHVDMIAHYDAYDYALLLPSTRTQGAEIFINRIIETLKAKPLGEVDPSQLTMAFGVSSIPEDFKDMSSLLGAADLAMNQAREQEKPVVIYRDIKSLVG